MRTDPNAADLSAGFEGGTADGETSLCSLSVPARAGSLKLVRALVGQVTADVGLSAQAVHDVVLAVDEACQNVVRHAFKGQDRGTLTLRVSRSASSLVIRLVDDATTIDPETIRPRALDDLRPGGLGTRLMNELLDEVIYEPPPPQGGNVLRLSKRIG